jgi:hypothetical protein
MNMQSAVTKLSLLIALIYSITGCSIAPSNMKDNTAIPSDSGVLVVGLHTDWEGHNNPILASLKLLYKGKKESDFSHQTMTFQGKDYIHVVSLPADQYEFSLLDFGNKYMELNREKSRFTITQGKTTYIGDIYATVDLSLFSAAATTTVKDQFKKMIEYMNTEYPLLTAKHPIEKQLVTIERK